MFEELFAKTPPDRIKPGLERIRRAYEFLGKPAGALPTVLVGGTNGKGTTAHFLLQMLEAQNLRVGLYTSPHLRHVAERFYVTGQTMDDLQVFEVWKELERSLPAAIYDELSFFEITTLVALWVFECAQPDVVILEVGLGGRWDATNITEPMVSVIVSLGIDHVEYLGNDPAAIAREKAGIMRCGRPCFVGLVSEDVGMVLAKEAEAIGCQIHRLLHEEAAVDHLQQDYLQHNRELAANVAKHLAEIFGWGFQERQGADLIPLLGRFQMLSIRNQGARQMLVDVCHNVDGAQAFGRSLHKRFGRVPIPGFVSILADKDVGGILDVLRDILFPIVLFKGNNVRCFNRLRVPERHRDLSFYDSFEQAFAHALEAWPPETLWVVCGSVITVGEVLDYFQAENIANGTHDLCGYSPLSLAY